MAKTYNKTTFDAVLSRLAAENGIDEAIMRGQIADLIPKSTVKRFSEAAETLAKEAEIEFPADFVGSGKAGKITVADVKKAMGSAGKASPSAFTTSKVREKAESYGLTAADFETNDKGKITAKMVAAHPRSPPPAKAEKAEPAYGPFASAFAELFAIKKCAEEAMTHDWKKFPESKRTGKNGLIAMADVKAFFAKKAAHKAEEDPFADFD